MKLYQDKDGGQVLLATKKECMGCLACVEACPVGAIESFNECDGHIYVRIDNNKCINCKKCEVVCTKARNMFGDNQLSKSDIFGAWSNDIFERKNGTSGGIFAAFARCVIENHGCVVGAAYDGTICKHIIIDKVEDIRKLQGSKYMQSSMQGIYKLIKEKLKDGDVLFSGLGCQCAGVLSYFNGSKLKYNLYTMDLVCGGMPSSILLEKFYKEHKEISNIVSFRTKDKYELKVKKNQMEEVLKERNLPLDGFNCGLTNRYSCYDCQFACAHRKTDFTIGDLWNYDILPNEHRKGVSMLIVHSDKGRNLVRKTDISYEPISWKETLVKNKRIVCGKQRVFFPRKRLERNASSYSYEKFRKLYAIAMKPKDVGMFIFRLYRYLVLRYDFWKNKRYINSLMKNE